MRTWVQLFVDINVDLRIERALNICLQAPLDPEPFKQNPKPLNSPKP